MKVLAVFVTLFAVAAAFAPAANKRVDTALAAKGKTEKTPLFESIFGMDLFAPDPTRNDYGARKRKNVSCNSGFGKGRGERDIQCHCACVSVSPPGGLLLLLLFQWDVCNLCRCHQRGLW